MSRVAYLQWCDAIRQSSQTSQNYFFDKIRKAERPTGRHNSRQHYGLIATQ